MIPVLLAAVWLPGLVFPFQVGRWCLRHGRPATAIALWALCALALGALAGGVRTALK